MQTINQTLSSVRHPFAVLAGAGVSIDPPSCLPSARSLVERALLHGMSGVITATDLESIIDRPADFLTRPGEFLRFEVALTVLEQEPRTSILGQLQSGTPNANHYALAQLIERGNIVITTNFDLHIETAYQHLYGCRCRVARRDAEFAAPPTRKSAGTLWKIHGCLTDVESLAATFTRILSGSSRRMDWFKEVLSEFDIIVMGYSGSDDLDLIPPMSRTITDRSLVWIHHNNSRKVERVTPQGWLAGSAVRMHLDCVGLNRVMFSCHSAQRPTRRRDAAVVLAGPTQSILNRILSWIGISPFIPSSPPPVPHMSKHQEIGDLDEFASASTALHLLEFARAPKVKALVNHATRQLLRSGMRQPASRQIDVLIRLFNSEATRQALHSIVADDSSTWKAIANNDTNAYLAKLDELEPMIGAPEASQAQRLRACLLYDRDRSEAQRCFEKSLRAAKECDDPFSEIGTLSTYRNLLYPSHFPVFWHEHRPFPHADRLTELVGSTGFVPMIVQGNLVRDVDYAVKLQKFSPSFLEEHASIGFYDVFWSATSARRFAIDLGDIRGEMEATFVIAELTLAAVLNDWDVPRFGPWIEWQRLDILAEALDARAAFGKRLSQISSVPAPDDEMSREELMKSMFSR